MVTAERLSWGCLWPGPATELLRDARPVYALVQVATYFAVELQYVND